MKRWAVVGTIAGIILIGYGGLSIMVNLWRVSPNVSVDPTSGDVFWIYLYLLIGIAGCVLCFISLPNEAVSPVSGVILMVAITVILAAVIASFVFGMVPTMPRTVTHCTVSNESALEAAWIDGYRTGISRAHAGNDTGWSWNYTVPECVP